MALEIAMVSLWHKYKNAPKRKRQALHSLFAGFVFFCFLYAISDIFSIRICPFYRLFGVGCFGCGLMRGFIAILRFKPLQSFQYHVLSLPLFVCIIVYFILCVIDVFFEKEYLSTIERHLAKPFMYAVYVGVLVIAMILNMFL